LRQFAVKIGFIELDNGRVFHGLRKVSPNLNNQNQEGNAEQDPYHRH
jgi:hypothetical protein